MKRIVIVSVVMQCLIMSAALAQHGVAVLGTYHDAKDGDAGYGGILRYVYDADPAGNSLRLLAQAGYLTGFGEENRVDIPGESLTVIGTAKGTVIPIEVGAVYDIGIGRDGVLYAGGGLGYYITDADMDIAASGTVDGVPVTIGLPIPVSVDMDDELGFFGLVGLEVPAGGATRLFAELHYTFLDVNTEVTVYNPQNRAESITVSPDTDLSGLGGAIGVRWQW
jgi:hypothetical protein